MTKLEKNYSVIEKECLALIYAFKQFRHYLLVNHFTVLTDHNPLIWLSSQRMQGRLCRWALALQDYDFTIKYRKGTQNSNADALSRLPKNTTAITEVLDGSYTKQQVQSLQQKDPTLNWVLSYLSENKQPSAQE